MHICSEKPQEEGRPCETPTFLMICVDNDPCNGRILEHAFCVVKVVSPSGSHLLSSTTLATLTATAGST